jgi:hypothetical protein
LELSAARGRAVGVLAAVIGFFGLWTVAPAAATVGIVPPRQPASNCPVSGFENPLPAINRCRAREGVGPMHLPSNWTRLSPVEQTFVAINLERVNRGMNPVLGLTRSLDTLAQKGANAGQDPPFPANRSSFVSGGSLLWVTASPLVAVWGWMYDDGPGGGNFGCRRSGAGDCWAHRNLGVLFLHSPLIGGAGHTGSNSTFLVLSVTPSSENNSFAFSWSSELRFFAHPPAPEPKG